MDSPELLTLRTALLITLSILLVAVLWRRFKRTVMANDMPAPMHVELVRLEVAYHPPRLHVVLSVPSEQHIATGLLDHGHTHIHGWQDKKLAPGVHTLELPLPTIVDGAYFLDLTTATQRTVRQFRLQQA